MLEASSCEKQTAVLLHVLKASSCEKQADVLLHLHGDTIICILLRWHCTFTDGTGVKPDSSISLTPLS